MGTCEKQKPNMLKTIGSSVEPTLSNKQTKSKTYVWLRWNTNQVNFTHKMWKLPCDLSNPVIPATNVLLPLANWQIIYSFSSIRKKIKIDFEYHIYS